MTGEKSESEQLLQFPCSFPIKAMGRDEAGFRDLVLGIVRAHAGDIADSAVRSSPSSKGKFVSVTVTINARSQHQLDCIYQDLSHADAVLFSL